jgi:hypothetical protein
MAYKMKGFGGFGNSPAKQGVIWGPKGDERLMDAFGKETKIEKDKRKKTYRKPGESKYQADVRRNKEQSKYLKDLPKANAEMYRIRKIAEDRYNKKKSPSKQKEADPNKASFLEKEQVGPIEGKKKQVPLQPGEMEGTSITGGSKSEERADLEDRIEFLTSDIEGGSDRPGQSISDMKDARAKLQKRLKEMGR